MRSLFLLLIFPIFLYSSSENIQKLAKQKELYKTNEWKSLLHYDDGFKVVDSNFLLSQNHSLKNELEATINGFYDLPSKYSDANLHPQCKFPARLLFISHELNISKDEFPEVNCVNLQVYEQKAPADEISLILCFRKCNKSIKYDGTYLFKI
ncbi:MAG: hypothetical protein Q9M40_01830 [Sulfurimonas sp.]|nr:hypothetical protein [Sulfurimonas sp.]